jgi:ABC-type bacteriocin/lantibiotic exporter with double-glycine peptidase domain
MANVQFEMASFYHNNSNRPVIKNKGKTEILSYVPTAAIMGNIGVGKTTLFNSLCGTQHIAEESVGI